MMKRCAAWLAGCLVMLAAAGLAQDGMPAPGAAPDGPPRGPEFERRVAPRDIRMESPSAAIRNLLANPGLAAGLSLTPEQLQSVARVDDETVGRSISTVLLVQILAAVVTDPDVSAKAGISAGQQEAIRKNLTPALLRKNLTAEQVDSVVRAVLSAGGGRPDRGGRGAPPSGIPPELKRFDKDGDGDLSPEERRAADAVLGH